MEYLKKRTLHLAIEVSEPPPAQEELLQSIQNIENIIDCKLNNRQLTIKYDLQKTSLQNISMQIRPILASYKRQQRNHIIDKIRLSFIYFTETNQQHNLHVFSGWNLRLQNIHLAMWADKTNDRDNTT